MIGLVFRVRVSDVIFQWLCTVQGYGNTRPGATTTQKAAIQRKNQSLSPLYKFTQIAVITLGALGEEASAFPHDLGHRINAVTDEPRSFQFLMQRQSVTVQRGNAACIIGTVPKSLGLDSIFYLYTYISYFHE